MHKLLMLIRSPKNLVRKLLHRLLNERQKLKLLSFPDELTIKGKIAEIASTSKNNTVFLFPAPSCPWGYMFQRPQQLAKAIAKFGYHVIYMVDTSFPGMPDWGVRGVKEVEKGVFLYNDGKSGSILFENFQGKNLVIWQYWPHQQEMLSSINYSIRTIKIYDCIDHLNTFISYPTMLDDFQTAITEADFVLATAKGIYEEVVKMRPDCRLVQNGVSTDDFHPIKEESLEQISQIRSKSDIIIGYYGAIADWFDFELIDWIANKNPGWTFLIVGEVYPSVQTEVNNIKKRKNIVMLPRLPYSDIPKLLLNFDVAIIPFVINEITLNTSPVKVYEYMAGGKQVVTTDLPEVRDLPGVLTSQNREEFESMLKRAIASKDQQEVKELLLTSAKKHSWTNRVREVIHLIEQRQE